MSQLSHLLVYTYALEHWFTMIGVLPIDGEFCYLLRNNLQNKLNQGYFYYFIVIFPHFA